MNSIDEKAPTSDEEKASGSDVHQEREAGKDVGALIQASQCYNNTISRKEQALRSKRSP
jgi:hypothetical protein